MLPVIVFQCLVSDIIQVKHQVLRSDTTEVSSIFNLQMLFSVSSRPSAACVASWQSRAQQLVSV